ETPPAPETPAAPAPTNESTTPGATPGTVAPQVVIVKPDAGGTEAPAAASSSSTAADAGTSADVATIARSGRRWDRAGARSGRRDSR
ncbi:MAG: beta-mannosidase, partial [Solirubrobacteraceae bacterium]